MSVVLNLLENIGYRFTGTGAYKRCIQHDSLIVNINKDVFYWNRLGIGGNAYQFLTNVEKLSPRDALKQLESLGLNSFTEVKRFEDKEQSYIIPDNNKIKYLSYRAKKYHESLLEGDKEYWYSQGINDSRIEKFNLGWTDSCPVVPYMDSYTIPYYLGEKVINIRHRLNTNSADKYRPEMSGLGNYMFNVNSLYEDSKLNWPGDAVVIEGEKKAIVFDQEGFRVVGIPGANAWKNHFLAEFKKAGIDYIYVLLDPGMEEQSEKIVYNIKSNGIKSKSIFLEEKSDDLINNGSTGKDLIHLF